jgi:hypothetical protein
MPEIAAGMSAPCSKPPQAGDSMQPPNRENPAMHNRNAEPNTELKSSFEPLRVIFALGALLLGFVAALHGA